MSYYTDKEIDEHLDPLKNNFNNEYFASLPGKFKKVAKEYTIDQLKRENWTSVMVENILDILEITSLTDRLKKADVINDEVDDLGTAIDTEELWSIFETDDEHATQDERAFVELHTLMTDQVGLGRGGVAPHEGPPVEVDKLYTTPPEMVPRGGKRSRRRRTKRRRTIGGKKSRRRLRKRTTIKGSKRKRRRTRG